ncbi:MAG: threonine-phosphate decarboxylase [Candidatus Tectomicrobia bacterium]|nr:threonine-phosphate decarboxylase [Candidatus Tectomicrobia bacterium]
MRDVHGGNIWRAAREQALDPDAILDFSASLNPLGPPAQLETVLAQAPGLVRHYPEPRAESLRERLAAEYGVGSEAILVGNGSCELLHLLGTALRPRRVLIPVPAFSEYEAVACRVGATVTFLIAREEDFTLDHQELVRQVPKVDLLFLGHPHSPTGSMLSPAALQEVLEACEDSRTILALDAVFADFAAGVEVSRLVRQAAAHPQLLLVRSFTKLYAIPGLRLGYLVGQPATVARLQEAQPPWSVNTLAQVAGLAMLGADGFAQQTRLFVAEERRNLFAQLSSFAALRPLPSQANFLLVKLEGTHLSAGQLCARLAARGLLVRDCTTVRGLGERYVRIAVRQPGDNQRLLAALRHLLDEDGCAAPP